MIARFAASPRGRQLASAKSLHREIEFLLAWPPNDSGRYIRGFIDCLYQDAAGEWRIVDYKTNNISPAEVKQVVQGYEMQLYVYAMAVEQALGTPPTELVLELLRPGIEHVIRWNDTARRRATEMVNEAIAAALHDPQPPAPSH